MDNMSNKLSGFFNLIRPFTLLAPLIVSICIMLASYFNHGFTLEGLKNIFFVTILPASFALALLNGGSNALNQASDVKSDSISKPYRPIPKGIISPLDAKYISAVIYLTAFIISFFVNPVFCLFVGMIILFTVTYSLPPRLKDRLFFNQVWIAVPRGFLGIMASWSVFGNPFDVLPLTIGFIALCFLFGGSITKDITDSYGDIKAGTKTLINTYGVKASAFMVLPFMFTPFLMTPLLIEYNLLSASFWPITFFVFPAFLIFFLMIKDDKKCRILENSSSWCAMYLTYFSLAFIFSIITIIDSTAAI
ncbi:MAG: UbiA family prenyltransferase [Candidatus Thermoplasmatota archaeon]